MGWLGDKLGFNDPMRTGGQYEGLDRGNFDLPGHAYQQDRLAGYLGGVDDRQAPQLGPQSEFRGQQSQLADILMGRAQGRDSVAEQQLRAGADMANRQQMSTMAGARPANAAMALRVGSQNQASTMMGLSGATAMARAQEAQQAAMGLGGLLGQARGADDQRQLSQAELSQRQMGLDDAARQGLLGTSLDAARAQQQGGMGYEQNRTSRYAAALGVPTKREAIMGALGGAMGGYTSAGGGG